MAYGYIREKRANKRRKINERTGIYRTLARRDTTQSRRQYDDIDPTALHTDCLTPYLRLPHLNTPHDNKQVSLSPPKIGRQTSGESPSEVSVLTNQLWDLSKSKELTLKIRKTTNEHTVGAITRSCRY